MLYCIPAKARTTLNPFLRHVGAHDAHDAHSDAWSNAVVNSHRVHAPQCLSVDTNPLVSNWVVDEAQSLRQKLQEATTAAKEKA